MLKHFMTLLAAFSLSLAAAEIPLIPGQKIQDALDRARPGDTIVLAPGVYREHIVFNKSGEYGKPITLTGPRTAVIDGAEDFPLKWEPFPEYGPRVWRAKLPEDFDVNPERRNNIGDIIVACKDGTVPVLFEDRVTINHSRNKKKSHDGTPYEKKKLFRDGIDKTGWNGLGGIAMYRQKEHDVLVAFSDSRPVVEQDIRIGSSSPAVKIKGDRCVVSGITIRHSNPGISIEKSRGSCIEDCRIERCRFGIYMCEGADHCTVRFCDISHDPICSMPGSKGPDRTGSWGAWKIYKRCGYWDVIAVNISKSKGGHRIHDNYLHDHWGGVQDVGGIGENMNLDVHHNRIDSIQDDGLEPAGAEENCRWYDNFITNCRCGFRIKQPQKGPMYAYNNILLENVEDFRNFRAEKNATVYVYHNTSVTKTAIHNNKVPAEIGTPDYHYLNNLFVCDRVMSDTSNPVFAKADWRDNGNLYLLSGKIPNWEALWKASQAPGFHATSRFMVGAAGFADLAGRNLAIAENSPARNAGADLSALKLPGMEKHPGGNPDVGAVPFGTSMPVIPRPRGAVQCEPAGFWPEQP